MWMDEVQSKCRLEYTIGQGDGSKEPLTKHIIEKEFFNMPMEEVVASCVYLYCNRSDREFLKFTVKMLLYRAEFSGFESLDSECQKSIDEFLDFMIKHYNIKE